MSPREGDRMKLCADCKHYIPGTNRWTDQCAHPLAAQTEPVRGESVPLCCMAMRENKCSEGKLWEPNLKVAS